MSEAGMTREPASNGHNYCVLEQRQMISGRVCGFRQRVKGSQEQYSFPETVFEKVQERELRNPGTVGGGLMCAQMERTEGS